MTLATLLAEEPRSQPVTDWAARTGWVVGLILFIALVYWLMREGWKWRGQLQSGIPDLPAIPGETGEVRLELTGRYHGTTAAGQWLDRIVAHGLGVRSRVELTLTEQGLAVVRPGATDFFIPTAHLRGARLDKAIAGKVLTEGGLLVVTWAHGGAEYDSGFRSDHAAEHAAWVAALGARTTEKAPADAAASTADSTTTEGTR
ncbi:hypothetical protein OG946_04345 [Streptomyces sp. NBC_01808]|uniref:PH-like domain-containing protein n=1 Tax=Streptomyces sp. NBC_01808 TaxID=2975947 RepID=UPI002DDC38B6|nr:hypothetical protein [Streptomyces sp. NBC_01808]WSA36684.1 hypothetical protein OG946_04345 [Streptomyces sp. NBC_01808]